MSSKLSRIENRGSKVEDRESRIESRGSSIEDRKSRIENLESKIENRGSSFWGLSTFELCSTLWFWPTIMLE